MVTPRVEVRAGGTRATGRSWVRWLAPVRCGPRYVATKASQVRAGTSRVLEHEEATDLPEDQDRPTFPTSDAVQRPVGVDGDRVAAGPKQCQIAGGVRIG